VKSLPICAFVLAWAMSATAFAECPSSGDLAELERQRSTAIAAHDTAFLDALYADRFRGVTGRGVEVDKATLLGVFERFNSPLRYTPDRLTPDDIGCGAAAIRGRLTGRDSDGRIGEQSLFLHVYAFEDGHWRMITGQTMALSPDRLSD
jgi:hypothetical protein